MTQYHEIKDLLDSHHIPFEIVEHPPAETTEQADSYIEGVDGVRTKSLFMTTKKKNAFYLLVMDDQKRLDMDAFREQIGASKLHLASPQTIANKLSSTPGVVSPFDLMHNVDNDIHVYYDTAIIEEARQSFHPGTNEKTLFLATEDLFTVIEILGYSVNRITLT